MLYGRLTKSAVRGAALAVIAIGGAVLATGCGAGDGPDGASETPQRLSGSAFGTFYEVRVARLDGAGVPDELHEAVEMALERVDASMSSYRKDSEVQQLNRTPVDEWMSVSESFFEVLQDSRRAHRRTRGAFDVTVGHLVDEWGFGPRGRVEHLPDDAWLEEAVSRVGLERLELDGQPPAARRRADFAVDVSGIAKGHGIAEVGRVLDEHGIDHWLVNIGGDVAARGRPTAERPWRVRVERPDGAMDDGTVIPLRDEAIATSGDYRNWYERDGQRFTHIIDPRTGRPVQHRLASVTVVHASDRLANALATGLLVLGEAEAREVIEDADLRAMLIARRDGGFATYRSPALRARLAASPQRSEGSAAGSGSRP